MPWTFLYGPEQKDSLFDFEWAVAAQDLSTLSDHGTAGVR